MCDGHTPGNFGCPNCAVSILEKKHGWVECKSTSFPGKVYYFHTVTRCSTWQRPVPRNTKLPCYKKYRNFRSLQSPTGDDRILSPSLGVSGSEASVLSSDGPPSHFELHARRMQIYLQKNTNYNLAMKFEGGETLRDKLLEYYKIAKSELAENLKQKKTQRKKTAAKVPNVKPSQQLNRPIDPVKTVRECHGIKTISYDPVPRELPAGVKMPALSETTVDTFGSNKFFEPPNIFDAKISPFRQGRAEGIADQNHNFGRFVFKDLNLSESDNNVSGGLDYLQS